MKKHPAPRSVVSNHSSVLDISIRGDDLENSRVALENNLQNTEISLRLSSTSDSEGEDLYQRRRPAPATTAATQHQSRAYHDSSEEEHVSSIEYPRHNSNPGAFQEFVSFDRASRDHISGLGDLSHHSSAHPYSFSPDDDEDQRMHGIDPFPTPGFPSMSLGSGLGRGHGVGGETISTAGHHASALTLSPGFGGGRYGRRRDPSMSGAEYDPDRPIKDMLDHVGMGMDRLSVFDIEPSRSRYPGVTSPNQGPKMDTTTDLDRILQSGHIPPSQLAQLRSPLNSSSSASSSSDQDHDHDQDAASNTSARVKPKLTDALKNNLTFSPKRPRTMVVSPPRQPQPQARRETRFAEDEPLEQPTPKPKRRITSMGTPHPASSRISHPHSTHSIDNASVVSAGSIKSAKSGKSNGSGKTTSDTGSQFTRMARGISKEIERQRGAVAESSRKALVEQENERKAKEERERLLREREERLAREREREREREAREREARERERERERKKAAEAAKAAKRPSALKKPVVADVSAGNGNVFLPDVTGLTSAVESPAKGLGMGGYRLYSGEGGSPREVEARFVATLNNVQSKLLALEEENGISRRRVHELEMELEDCKREVRKERTRVLERDNDLSMQRHLFDKREKERREKGKARATDEDDWQVTEKRYKEAVEEKKALESLIATLRSHLTRLTSELSSHQDLLSQLRELRDEDATVARAKFVEIEKLKDQVETLGGEVEVLRGVVEEGLRERRGRERGMGDETRQEEVAELPNPPPPQRQPQAPQPQDSLLAHQDHHFDHTEAATLAASTNTPRHGNGFGHNRALGEMSEKTRKKHREDYGYAYDASTAVPMARFMDSAEFERISASRSLDGTRLDGRDDLDDDEEEEEEEVGEEEEEVVRRMGRRATVEDDVEEDEDDDSFHRPESPSPPSLASIQAQVSAAGPSRPHTRHHQHHQDTQHTRAHTRPARPITSSPIANPSAGRRRSTSGGAGDTQTHTQPPTQTQTPFPQIRGTHLEKLFFAAPDHDEKTCGVCLRKEKATSGGGTNGGAGAGGTEHEQVEEWFRRREERRRQEEEEEEDEGFAEEEDEPRPTAVAESKGKGKEQGMGMGNSDPNRWKLKTQGEGLPPQTVVARVIRELEDDFTHYKGIYCELADQYKEMDPVSDVPKRNVLARHLREVVDILEQKGDQIAALYDTLAFKDKPLPESVTGMPRGPPPLPTTTTQAKAANTQSTPLATKLRNLSTMAVASGSVAKRGGGGGRGL